MGLTIHYDLKSAAASPEQARQLVEQLRQAALDLAMSEVGEIVEFSEAACNFQSAKDDSDRWLLVQARRMIVVGKAYATVVPSHAIAFSTWPGDGCEVANFGLARYPDTLESRNGAIPTGLSGWSWQSFCKTQYSSNPDVGGIANFVRCHLAVIRLLDRAKTMDILEAVKDESHFWEKRDVKALVETVGKWNSHIAGIVGQYKDQIGGDFAAPITEFPNFEHLEAQGRKGEDGDLDS
ncbi:MAG: hypothetical protein ACYC0Y_28120 [Pirellulales bacterium]